MKISKSVRSWTVQVISRDSREKSIVVARRAADESCRSIPRWE